MKFRISLAQINPRSGDLRGNSDKILRGMEQARRERCDLVVFPELCLTGYCLDEKLLINRQFLRENKRRLCEEIVTSSQGLAAIVGFIDFNEHRRGPDGQFVRHNAAAIIQNEKLLQIVHKRLLPAYRYFDDKRYFVPGRRVEPVVLETINGKVSIGVLICEDLWTEGYNLNPCAIYKEKGTDYVFCINASPFVGSSPGQKDGKRFIRERITQQQATRYDMPIVYVNTVGIGDNGKNIIPFDGLSMAYDRSGKQVAALEQFVETQRFVEFENGIAPRVEAQPFDREAEIYHALVMSVRDYFDKIGIFKRVLEAISGGIDSSLGTAIAFEAMGRDLLSVYNLPSRYNSAETQQVAQQLVKNFCLDYHVVPIQEMVDRVVQDFERHLHPVRHSITLENLQARIRGLIMMAESNDQQGLLLTNGNETEIALGYTTLYGDMVGGLSVIGDLPKPDVYRLAGYVNRKWNRPMIPLAAFQLAPSAELAADQQDPFNYEVIGPLVSEFIESGLSVDELVQRFVEGQLWTQESSLSHIRPPKYDRESFQQLAQTVYRSLNRSVYKRLQGAPIIVVSKRAFGFDLRETIINAWDKT